jgi:hypothetical protein
VTNHLEDSMAIKFVQTPGASGDSIGFQPVERLKV